VDASEELRLQCRTDILQFGSILTGDSYAVGVVLVLSSRRPDPISVCDSYGF
jgi:hypothetical protein